MRNIREGASRTAVAAAVVVAVVLCAAPVALAKVTTSSNWAGFAVHRPGVAFRTVSGTWTQPAASCVAGQSSYSAVWVGIGGFKPTSDALEQIGTEVDCHASGRAVSSAWYELVPAPSKTISFVVDPGDVVHATVTVVGHQVTVELQDLTRNRTFRKTLFGSSIDTSSAEWIVEAPSECMNQVACQALPLANFGSVSFDSATATSTTATTGSILDAAWWRTKIRLTPSAQRFIVARQTSDTAGTATPSTLRAGGRRFDVTYSTVPVTPQTFAGPRQSFLRAAYLVH